MNIRVCTYNVKNLFLAGEGETKPPAEMRPLARMLDQVDADFIGLQEVGSRTSLEQLNERLRRPYPHLGFAAGNSTRSIGLGVLSREPVSVDSHAEQLLCDPQGGTLRQYLTEADAMADNPSPLRFQRDALLVQMGSGSHALAIVVVHLKSRTNRTWQLLSAEEMRAAEARRLADIVADNCKRFPLILMGDLNDHWSADALAPLRELGLRDPVGEALQQQGRNPSTYWPRRRMRLDHILVMPDQRIQTNDPVIHASRMAQTASDHYPVSIEVNWRKA